jgi:hypothetical protein
MTMRTRRILVVDFALVGLSSDRQRQTVHVTMHDTRWTRCPTERVLRFSSCISRRCHRDVQAEEEQETN